MRTKTYFVTDPKIIRAEICQFKEASKTKNDSDVFHPQEKRVLKIEISTNKVEAGMEIDTNKVMALARQGIPCDVHDKKYLKFYKKPVRTELGLIWLKRNSKTKFKDFLYVLRNPHSALLFVNSENEKLKLLAHKIIEGYKIIFPRETRYYGSFKENLEAVKSKA